MKFSLWFSSNNVTLFNLLRQFQHTWIMSFHHIFYFYGHQMELIVDSVELLVGINRIPFVNNLIFFPWCRLDILNILTCLWFCISRVICFFFALVEFLQLLFGKFFIHLDSFIFVLLGSYIQFSVAVDGFNRRRFYRRHVNMDLTMSLLFPFDGPDFLLIMLNYRFIDPLFVIIIRSRSDFDLEVRVLLKEEAVQEFGTECEASGIF